MPLQLMCLVVCIYMFVCMYLFVNIIFAYLFVLLCICVLCPWSPCAHASSWWSSSPTWVAHLFIAIDKQNRRTYHQVNKCCDVTNNKMKIVHMTFARSAARITWKIPCGGRAASIASCSKASVRTTSAGGLSAPCFQIMVLNRWRLRSNNQKGFLRKTGFKFAAGLVDFSRHCCHQLLHRGGAKAPQHVLVIFRNGAATNAGDVRHDQREATITRALIWKRLGWQTTAQQVQTTPRQIHTNIKQTRTKLPCPSTKLNQCQL